MTTRIVQVDSFTRTPFKGNPAAVCVLESAADAVWMQNVAREMNLSETAFLYPEREGYRLRWFGPSVEVDLCGHATLASAHVLWEDGILPSDAEITFLTRSGILSARKQDNWIMLNFPLEPASEIVIPPLLTEAFGVELRYVGENRVDYIIEVGSERILRDLKPDFGKLQRFSDRGFMVTSRSSTPGYDYVSRFFAPGRGVNEDPVTGSSHCCLGPFWQQRLQKNELIAYQASLRGGVAKVKVLEDRVDIGGQAVTVLRGELLC
jgi:predicted PhzF superfamily epimerase YddE/YHI9